MLINNIPLENRLRIMQLNNYYHLSMVIITSIIHYGNLAILFHPLISTLKSIQYSLQIYTALSFE